MVINSQFNVQLKLPNTCWIGKRDKLKANVNVERKIYVVFVNYLVNITETGGSVSSGGLRLEKMRFLAQQRLLQDWRTFGSEQSENVNPSK